MLDLGYSFNAVMEIGGWDSVENFLFYTRACNRRKSRLLTRGFLRNQLLGMQNANYYLRRRIFGEEGCIQGPISSFAWLEAMLEKSLFQKEEGASSDDEHIGENRVPVTFNPSFSFSREVRMRSLSREDTKELRHKSRKVIHTVRNVTRGFH